MKQFCFIICTNDDLLLEECKNYISRLFVPDGYTTDIITIKDAPSMAAAYNAAMNASDADYKIYLHQDLFIANRYFLYNIHDIFSSDQTISMIGMVGTASLPSNAIMWTGKRHGVLWSYGEGSFDERISEIAYFESTAIDGAIMVTSKDVPWREDIFDGFDFYDISECFEHRRKGYKIVVPSQSVSWCIHDDGYYLTLYNYNKYRRRLLQEYSINEFALSGLAEDVQIATPEKEAGYNSYLENLENSKKELLELEAKNLGVFDNLIKSGNYDSFIKNASEIRKAASNDSIIMTAEFQMLINIASALVYEANLAKKTFLSDTDSLESVRIKYTTLQLLLRRLEVSPNEEWSELSCKYIDENNISPYIIAEMLYCNVSKYERRNIIFAKLISYFSEHRDYEKVITYTAVFEKYAKEQ